MAHSERYPDGSRLDTFFGVDDLKKSINETFANKFGALAEKAFENGACKVEQRISMGNEPCPKCESGLRFDLCCLKNSN